MRGIALALKGAFIEMCQLLLLFAAAAMGASFFIDSVRFHAKDAALLLGFFAAYSLFVLYPARDLVQGWLGMVARRRPARYDERWENVGRAVVATVGATVLLLVPSWHGNESREAQAFDYAFLGMALIVFGFGSAVPRWWFAFRPGSDRSDEVPALLGQAGRRAALFFYCAFMGIGIALATARVVGS